jgi:ligand-binding SRPBCC domain-containing protein
MAKVFRFQALQTLPIGLEEAWDFFSDPRNLSAITPPELGFKLLTPDPPRMHPGQMLEYSVRPFPGFRTGWLTEITHVRELEYFVDEQRMGPYRLWHHEHHFRPVSGGVEMEDIVHYALPFGPLGALFGKALVRRTLKRIFSFRARILTERLGSA